MKSSTTNDIHIECIYAHGQTVECANFFKINMFGLTRKRRGGGDLLEKVRLENMEFLALQRTIDPEG